VSAVLILPNLGIATFCQMVSFQLPFAFYQSLHKFGRPAVVLTFEALTNLTLSVLLARRLGFLRVAVGTLTPTY
jgi:O-antigen/teichoic acid export membrane protein